VGAVLCVWEKREKREKGIVCGGWRPCTLKKLKVKDSKGRGGAESVGNLLLGVQCGEARGYLGCTAVKKIVTHFLTMAKNEIKINFRDTGEIIGGAGRSPF